jgi:phage replication-related protein YjqB (UPF0714/DUF867 family)
MNEGRKMQTSPRKADKYSSFEKMRSEQKEGIDYEIEIVNRHTSVALIAPHAGHIETGTTEITKAIAGDDYSFYCFNGMKAKRPHHELHITSSNFDEPKGRGLAEVARIVITIHGRSDDGDSSAIWLGGLDFKLKDEIASKLNLAGFGTLLSGHKFEGKEQNNICNQGTSRAGVQFELPRTLRQHLNDDGQLLSRFVKAVRDAISQA